MLTESSTQLPAFVIALTGQAMRQCEHTSALEAVCQPHTPLLHRRLPHKSPQLNKGIVADKVLPCSHSLYLPRLPRGVLVFGDLVFQQFQHALNGPRLAGGHCLTLRPGQRKPQTLKHLLVQRGPVVELLGEPVC